MTVVVCRPYPLTVVALLALGAVTAHVTETTARVAGRLASTTVTTGAGAVATTTSSKATIAVAASLGAVAGNVTDLTALVALLAAATTASHWGTAVLGALTRDVSSAAATVASLLSLRRAALTANVTLLATVVAGWGALGRALGSAVRRIAACTLLAKGVYSVSTCNRQLKGQKWRLSLLLKKATGILPIRCTRKSRARQVDHCGVTVARVPFGNVGNVQLTVVAATAAGASSRSRCLVFHI